MKFNKLVIDGWMFFPFAENDDDNPFFARQEYLSKKHGIMGVRYHIFGFIFYTCRPNKIKPIQTMKHLLFIKYNKGFERGAQDRQLPISKNNPFDPESHESDGYEDGFAGLPNEIENVSAA